MRLPEHTETMEFTAQQIAGLLGGTVEGNPEATVHTFAKIEEGKPGALSFLANAKYAHYLYETRSSIVLVNKDFEPEHEVKATLIRVEDAYGCVARLLTLYEQAKPRREGIHPLACIAPTATVGEGCYVGPLAYIGENVRIGKGTQVYAHAVIEEGAQVGDDCIVYPGVSVYHDCVVGNRVILHSGCVIGADGFGFAPTPEGYRKIPQIGTVVIGDDVEIGANACVDRSTMGATRLASDVKIDNLVQIAHNCEIGSHTVISAQTGIAGSTKVGKWVMMGGQVGIAGHVQIADGVKIGAQAGVIGNVKEGVAPLWGTPAIDHGNSMRSWAVFKRLPEMQREVRALRKEIERLKAAQEKGNE